MRNMSRKRRKGIVGIEAAIVMIAFVIVAAALAFVVLNMGFFTTQRTKQAISSGLSEATTAIEVEGTVIGHRVENGSSLDWIAIPIKLSSGQQSIDLDDSRVAISYISDQMVYSNIYAGPTTDQTYQEPSTVADSLTATSRPNATIFWTVSNESPPNTVLDPGEHAVLVVKFDNNNMPSSYDTITVEIVLPSGASMTVSRQVPVITDTIVVLG